MKKLFFAIAVSLLLIGCGSGTTTTDKGQHLLEAELLVNVDKSILGTTFGYQAYKITYNTLYKNQNTVASGLLVLPTGYESISGFSLSMVCDAHGTVFANTEVPSANFAPNLNPIGAGFSATAGFATIQPDFIGFGNSSSVVHPYMIKDPLASSSIDMVLAVIEFASQKGIPINGQLFLSGYSEGGYATMATLKEIEEHFSDTLTVKAAAPMAAPYNIDLMAQGVLSSDTMGYSPFMGFVAYAYAEYYDNIALADLINPPYLGLLPSLFNGSKTGDEIYPYLTNVTQELFTPTILQEYFTNPDNSFKHAMVENSISNWTPHSKLRLYHCDEDNLIPYQFSQEAYSNFVNNGAPDVELVTLHGNDHRECASIAYPQVIAWFANVRAGIE